MACGALVAGLALGAGLPLRTLARRLVVELPFLLFAAVLPFVARGERVEVLGILHLSSDGMWRAWGILATATLGLADGVVTVAAQPVADLLHGLQRIPAPGVLTTTAAFMLRSLAVATAELQRLQV